MKIENNSRGNLDSFPGSSSGSIENLMNKILLEDDYNAFQTLFKNMYAPLCQFCVQFVLVKEVAEELVSDVFYNIWKNRSRITVSSHKAYLFTAVRNKGFDYLRSIKKSMWCDLEKAINIPSQGYNSYDLMIENELSTSLEQSIESLPKQCKLIFEMSREHGMKYKEIAEKLQISIKTVETQMGRALKHLRESLPAA